MSTQPLMQTFDNQRPDVPMVQRHIVSVPALCPATANPQPGSTITVTYIPKAKLLELYALTAYVHSFIGHNTVRDIEYFAQLLAQNCADALGVQVCVRANFVLNIDQVIKLRIKASPLAHSGEEAQPAP